MQAHETVGVAEKARPINPASAMQKRRPVRNGMSCGSPPRKFETPGKADGVAHTVICGQSTMGVVGIECRDRTEFRREMRFGLPLTRPPSMTVV